MKPLSATPRLTEGSASAQGETPPTRPVRHCFWKYPVLALITLVVVAVLAITVGSPNWPRDHIAAVAREDPGGAILAFTQELDGTAASSANADENGMGDPADIFVIGPLQQAAPLLRSPRLDAALSAYLAANPAQRLAWASAYDKALATITPKTGTGEMAITPSPDDQRIASLKGDFGPVPILVQTDLMLAQNGFLEQYLLAVHPDHSFHLVDIWLYDHPAMLNTALANGLTDDQWGMVKERGFAIGPWYLFLPAVIHVEIPNGSSGPGFVLDNLILAAFFLFGVPLIPGLRDLPRYLRLYRLIYRYPLPGELDAPELRPRPEGYHQSRGTMAEVAS